MQLSRLKVTWPFQALADETRFRVLRLIAASGLPLTVGQLAAILEIPGNHLSRHLQILEAAGLTVTERKGRSHYIRIVASGDARESLYSAVRSMADETGILSQDLTRLTIVTQLTERQNCYSSVIGGSSTSAESGIA